MLRNIDYQQEFKAFKCNDFINYLNNVIINFSKKIKNE